MKKVIKCILMLVTLGLMTSCADDKVSAKGDFSMKAVVQSVGEKIEINVYEAEYAEGIYWIVYDKNTVFADEDGNKISLSEIKAGDKIEVFFSGQVMMSYPPQVYAISIVKL